MKPLRYVFKAYLSGLRTEKNDEPCFKSIILGLFQGPLFFV